MRRQWQRGNSHHGGSQSRIGSTIGLQSRVHVGSAVKQLSTVCSGYKVSRLNQKLMDVTRKKIPNSKPQPPVVRWKLGESRYPHRGAGLQAQLVAAPMRIVPSRLHAPPVAARPFLQFSQKMQLQSRTTHQVSHYSYRRDSGVLTATQMRLVPRGKTSESTGQQPISTKRLQQKVFRRVSNAGPTLRVNSRFASCGLHGSLPQKVHVNLPPQVVVRRAGEQVDSDNLPDVHKGKASRETDVDLRAVGAPPGMTAPKNNNGEPATPPNIVDQSSSSCVAPAKGASSKSVSDDTERAGATSKNCDSGGSSSSSTSDSEESEDCRGGKSGEMVGTASLNRACEEKAGGGHDVDKPGNKLPGRVKVKKKKAKKKRTRRKLNTAKSVRRKKRPGSGRPKSRETPEHTLAPVNSHSQGPHVPPKGQEIYPNRKLTVQHLVGGPKIVNIRAQGACSISICRTDPGYNPLKYQDNEDTSSSDEDDEAVSVSTTSADESCSEQSYEDTERGGDASEQKGKTASPTSPRRSCTPATRVCSKINTGLEELRSAGFQVVDGKVGKRRSLSPSPQPAQSRRTSIPLDTGLSELKKAGYIVVMKNPSSDDSSGRSGMPSESKATEPRYIDRDPEKEARLAKQRVQQHRAAVMAREKKEEKVASSRTAAWKAKEKAREVKRARIYAINYVMREWRNIQLEAFHSGNTKEDGGLLCSGEDSESEDEGEESEAEIGNVNKIRNSDEDEDGITVEGEDEDEDRQE